mmetsp:Transcript_68508/g.182288  ORF Transcript_68508/g.182288 Transcript_68508/m.182288 type:complete len:274 (-) Transcript_68508:515-1336(-)
MQGTMHAWESSCKQDWDEACESRRARSALHGQCNGATLVSSKVRSIESNLPSQGTRAGWSLPRRRASSRQRLRLDRPVLERQKPLCAAEASGRVVGQQDRRGALAAIVWFTIHAIVCRGVLVRLVLLVLRLLLVGCVPVLGLLLGLLVVVLLPTTACLLGMLLRMRLGILGGGLRSRLGGREMSRPLVELGLVQTLDRVLGARMRVAARRAAAPWPLCRPTGVAVHFRDATDAVVGAERRRVDREARRATQRLLGLAIPEDYRLTRPAVARAH